MDQLKYESPGRKDDTGKPRFSLLRFGVPRALEGVAKVLTFGARKYADHSWQRVTNAQDRYWSAMERHMNAIGRGESHDPESGLLHIDHITCNALFLSELAHREERNKSLGVQNGRAGQAGNNQAGDPPSTGSDGDGQCRGGSDSAEGVRGSGAGPRSGPPW